MNARKKQPTHAMAVTAACALGVLLAMPAHAAMLEGTTATGGAPGSAAMSPLESKTSLLPSFAASATSTLYEGTKVFDTVAFDRIEFIVPVSGLLTVSLTDLLFPGPTATLDFALVDGSAVLGVIDGSGTLQYSVVTSTPRSLFGYVFAVAAPGINSGAYSLDVKLESTVAPVPLPAAGWMLLSGIGLLGFSSRRRADSSALAATA